MDTTPIPYPTLDPRDEQTLVQQAQIATHEVSQGRLNDFSPHSPLTAFLQGMAYSGAELLWYINRLPDALAIAFLSIAGIQRNLGTHAKGTVTFVLTSALTTPFTIPSGFVVTDSSGEYVFETDNLTIIAPGATEATATVTAEAPGMEYNLPPFSLTNFTVPLAFLQAVYNPQATTGGTSEETLDAAKARGFEAIRDRRVLISQEDYETAAESLMGQGSRAVAIPRLDYDKTAYPVQGVVHVFGLNGDGSAPNAAQLADIGTQLQSKVLIGTSVFFSALEVQPVDAVVIARLIDSFDPSQVAQDIHDSLASYLDPTQFPAGGTVLIDEAQYAARNVAGVAYIQNIQLNGNIVNVPMAHRYSVPRLASLMVELVDSSGQVLQYGFGEGSPD